VKPGGLNDDEEQALNLPNGDKEGLVFKYLVSESVETKKEKPT
jgi:hypothetical protein